MAGKSPPKTTPTGGWGAPYGNPPGLHPPGGEGWGGPAKGASAPSFNSDPLPYQGRRLAPVEKLEKTGRIERLVNFQEAVALDPETPLALAIVAADKVLNRLDGMPSQKVLLAGGEDGDNPVSHKLTIEFIKPT